MKRLYQYLIILVFSVAGHLLALLIPLPIPASVYGLLLLFLVLCLRIVPLTAVEEAGNSLVSLLTLLFVAPAVQVLDIWPRVVPYLLPIAVIVVLSTVVSFSVSGKLAEVLLGRGDTDD